MITARVSSRSGGALANHAEHARRFGAPARHPANAPLLGPGPLAIPLHHEVAMRILGLFLLLLALVHPASAQSYRDRKDADAIGVIERSLAKIDRIPSLFDGSRIPAGADLGA